jgi:hypothetical protein
VPGVEIIHQSLSLAKVFPEENQITKNILKKMNLPTASHGVSVKDKFNPNAASCGELNPADFAISTSHSL